MVAAASTSVSLKEYLKKYESGNGELKKKKKKKKSNDAKASKNESVAGVLIVDEDPMWHKPVNPEVEEDNASEGDEIPVVDEDIEVKRMKRLELLRSRKPYLTISDDGSGWTSVSDAPKGLSFNGEVLDLSPPRQKRARFDTPSPEREPKLSDSGDSDFFPPRQRRQHYETPSPGPESKPADSRDLSPPRRRQLAEDLSPPRPNRRHSPVLGASRGSRSIDLSPPRRSKKGLSPVPPEPHGAAVSDLSPPRKNRKVEDLSPPRRIRHGSQNNVKPQETTADHLSNPIESRKESSSAKEGRRAGLFMGHEIKKEIDRKKKEEKSRFAAMDPALSGRGAEPVHRDKEGKRISKEEMLKLQKGEEKPKEKHLEWGKGLAQKKEAEARLHELELEKDKPFARTRDDPDLDKMLKERLRWGDPMAHLVKSKQPELVLEDFGEDEKIKESGFIVPQSIPSHSWIKRGIDPVPNRYGIRPGRHWDGVDRSTGYEKELFKRQNEKLATETEAYLWSVSDM